jgi:hypothetical protein
VFRCNRRAQLPQLQQSVRFPKPTVHKAVVCQNVHEAVVGQNVKVVHNLHTCFTIENVCYDYSSVVTACVCRDGEDTVGQWARRRGQMARGQQLALVSSMSSFDCHVDFFYLVCFGHSLKLRVSRRNRLSAYATSMPAFYCINIVTTSLESLLTVKIMCLAQVGADITGVGEDNRDEYVPGAYGATSILSLHYARAAKSFDS